MHDEGQTSRLEALFDQAIELPSDQRRSFLTEKCGDDLELLRQLEALLSHVQEVPGDFLEAPLPLPPMHDATSTIESGQVIGNHFRLLRRLGEGGMGIVFLAEQDSPRRQVALKVIRPGIISRQSLRRFEFEHETLGRLHHPGIAQIYEAGLHASNDDPESTTSQPYFAMEYVLGPSLLDYVQENQLTIKAKLRLFVKICRAVQHAHQHGVIHRDLKPGNILVVDEAGDGPGTSFDDVGQPKILDFGVARSTDPERQTTTLQTDIGQLIGTLPYMSPEQMTGDSQLLDARSDVYSLGVILYQLLSGRLPHDLGGKMLPESVRIIADEEPPPMSTSNRLLRGDLDTIVTRAIEKAPSRRYQSALELALDVQRYLDDEPIVARPASAIYQIRKFARRNKALVGGAMVAVLLLVIGIFTTSTQAVRATRASETSLELKLVAENESASAHAVSDFLSEMLESVSPQEAGDEVTVREALDTAAATIAEAFPEQPTVEAAIRHTIGRSYRAIGEYDSAGVHLTMALEIYQTQYKGDHPEIGYALESIGVLAWEQGKYDEAELTLNDALAMRRRLYGDEHERVASTLKNLGVVYLDTGRYAEAEASLREAVEMERRVELSLEKIADTLATLAASLSQQDKHEEAETFTLEALDAYRNVYGEEHAHVARCLNNLSVIYSKQGRNDEAVPLTRQAIEIESRVYGADHPRLAIAHFNLGMMLRSQKSYGEAEVEILEAHAIWQVKLGDEHAYTLAAQAALGGILMSNGKVDEAEPVFREVLATRLRVLGTDHPETFVSQMNMGWMHSRRGEHEPAVEYYRTAIEGRRRVLGADHSRTLSACKTLADLHWGAREFEDAEPLYREVFQGWEAKSGPTHARTIAALKNLAGILNELERDEEALELWEDLLQRRREFLPEDHPDLGASLHSIGLTLLNLDRYEEAEEALREGVELRIRALGDAHWLVFNSRGLLGSALVGQQRHEEAEDELVQAYEGLEANPEVSPSRMCDLIRRLVDLYEAWENFEAETTWRNRLANCEQ